MEFARPTIFPPKPYPPMTKYHVKKFQNAKASPRVQVPKGPSSANPRFAPHSARIRNRRFRGITSVVPNGPISPEEAIDRYRPFLTQFELEEIRCFPEIYYVGQINRKIFGSDDEPFNCGYDNENNNYNLIAGDHLAYRYEILSLFGAGAFGQVCRCYDHKYKIHVAVKVIVNTEQMHEQGRIEAQILSRINTNDVRHCVRAYDFFIFRSHICITFEILSRNLFETLETNNYKPISDKLTRLYALQIFSALEHIHRLEIVHCDLKPENVLLCSGSNSLIKIIDFGSSCFAGHQIYEYIQSRFYRAPEVMLGISYGPPMDVWSSALIIVELLTGTPLFPGNSEDEVLDMIIEILGYPSIDLILRGKRKDEFFDDNFRLKCDHRQLREPGSKTLSEATKIQDPSCLDFLSRCLTWNQEDRITAAEALKHPWIRSREVVVSKRPRTGLPELK